MAILYSNSGFTNYLAILYLNKGWSNHSVTLYLNNGFPNHLEAIIIWDPSSPPTSLPSRNSSNIEGDAASQPVSRASRAAVTCAFWWKLCNYEKHTRACARHVSSWVLHFSKMTSPRRHESQAPAGKEGSVRRPTGVGLGQCRVRF